MVIDLTKIIELKRILSEKFDVILHVHDTCSGQYFEPENITPTAKDYIVQYLGELNYQVIWNEELTEFHLNDIRTC